MSKTQDKNNLFEVLIQEIMSTSDFLKREQFIRKNYQKIIPLVKWLAKTVTTLDNKIVVGLKTEPKVPKLPSIEDDEDSELANSESIRVTQFSLDCLLFISSAATSDVMVPELCEAILEQKNFLYHLNFRLFTGRANDSHLGILVNYTRYVPFVDQLVESVFPRLKNFFSKLIGFLELQQQPPTTTTTTTIDIEYNNKHLLSAYLTNLTQSAQVRAELLEQQLLFKLFDIYDSKLCDCELKKSCISIVRNCCFETDSHSNLISDTNVDLLVKLTLPLAGPEEFDSDDMKSLPIDLQYLGLDKTRETSEEIRRLLLETLIQLCSTRYGRTVIRNSNIYYILREYHKWETDNETLCTLENLIDVLIKTEQEINVDNLKQVDIPDELITKFEKLDEEVRNGEPMVSQKEEEPQITEVFD